MLEHRFFNKLLEKLEYAESILARAKLARPEIVWEIKKKDDSYSVREKQPKL